MFYFILVGSILIVLITLCIAVLQFILLLDVVLVGHDFATSSKGINQVSKILKDLKKDTGIFYDLGSARGNFAVNLSKICPNLKVFGVDKSRLRIIFSNILSKFFSSKAKFIRQNIFNADISLADVVYLYLKDTEMPALEAKLKNELKSGAMVITNTQSFPSWQVHKSYITYPEKPEYEKMFVYIKS
jgi:NADPH:quinone reductase-like Zn-dependent oxidoreductase